MNTRAELDAYFERVPEHVLTVLDQAYFEYIDDPDYADGIEEYFKAGRRVIVLRTFSKIYGLAGCASATASRHAELVTALGKTRRAFDLTTPGAGGGAREPRRPARSSHGAASSTAGAAPSSSAPARRGLRRSSARRLSATSSTWRSATTRRRCSTRCCARA